MSIGVQVVNLGSGIVLARGLGPAGRGDLAIAMLWPTLIAGMGLLGVSDAVVYIIGRDSNRSAELLNSALLIGIAQSALLVAVGWIVLPYVLAGKPAGVIEGSLLYLWFIPLVPLTGYPLAVLQGRLFLGPFNLARASVHIFYTAGLVGLWAAHAVTVRSALIASLLGTVFTSVLTSWLVATRVRLRPELSLKAIRSLLSYGTRLHIGNVATLIVQRADLLVLSMLAPAATLGNYVVATAIGVGAGLIPGAVSMVLFPLFSNREREAAPHAIARFMLVAGSLTILTGPLLAIVLPRTLPYLFGAAFEPAQSISMILVPAYLIRGWNQMLSSILRGTGQALTASAGELAGLVVMLAFLIYLVPALGALGAALSVLIGACAMFGWIMLRTFHASGLTFGRTLQFWSADLRAFARLARSSREAGS